MMRSRVTTAAIAVLVVLLAASVVMQVWLLPSEVRLVVATFPEVEWLAAPAIAWGVIAIACWQVAGIAAIGVAASTRRGEIEYIRSRWARALMSALLGYIALAALALVGLTALGYGTPAVMLGLIATGLLAVFIVAGFAAKSRHFARATI